MARPADTYTSQVFNFGVDKNIPFGFVDVVFDRSGNAVGFEKDGKFYNLGEQVEVAKAAAKPVTSKALSKRIDMLERKLNLAKYSASNTNIGEAERNRYINEYRTTAEELVKTQKSLLETQVREGKVKESTAQKKAADVIRFDIRTLEERRKLEVRLGKTGSELDNEIQKKKTELNNVLNPKPVSYGTQPSTVPQTSMPFGGKTVSGATLAPAATSVSTPTPTSAGAVAGAGGTPAAGKGSKGGKAEEEVTDKRSKEQRYSDAVAKAQQLYNMPDIIFRNIGTLGELLRKYVDGKLTDQQFALEIQNDPWYRSNSAEIKARYVQLFNYEDLVKQGRATGTTDYEQQLARITRNIQAKARELNGVEIPDDQAKLMAKDLYIYNLDNDPSVITERLVRFIRPTAGMIGGVPTLGYSGQALQNYQTLQAVAKANGLKIQDLLPRDATGAPMTAEGTLEQLALGKLDINRIAQDARKLAALGQSDYVKDLLGQGYDLETIYAPYKNTMASILEVDPNTISLSDSALRMGIGKEGDMNLYDFERALRQDSRWQYTQQARGEVADVALRVLRDFGFTG